MKKNALILTIMVLLFCTLSYTYSAFKNVVVGTINVSKSSNWVFKFSVSVGTKEDGYYKVPITKTSGSFTINLDSTDSLYVTGYSIELEPVDLPYDIVSKLNYEGIIDKTTKSISVSYSSDTTPNGYIKVYAKGKIGEYATMKNGYSSSSDLNGGTEFWNSDYKSYIKTITFANDLSEMPSSCTEENLCFDVTEEGSQEKVYGYLVDSGEVDSDSNTLYDLNIVSILPIFLPSNCSHLFSDFTSLDSLTFNDNFHMSNVTDMEGMFANDKALINLDFPRRNTSSVSDMTAMFAYCSSLVNLYLYSIIPSKGVDMTAMFAYCSSLKTADLGNYQVFHPTNMYYMFYNCTSLEVVDLEYFDTSNVTDMAYMFYNCSSLTVITDKKSKVDFSNFDTSNVTNMSYMFYNCASIVELDLSYFDTSNVTNMSCMIYSCASLAKLDLSNLYIVGYLCDIVNNCSTLTTLILRNADFSKALYKSPYLLGNYPIKYLDFSDIKNYNFNRLLFYNSRTLEILNLSNFRFYNQENASVANMFQFCSNLTTIILTGFDTSNVTNMGAMFNGCSSLTSLDLTSFNTSSVTIMAAMFSGCSSLTSLDLRSFDTSNVTDMRSMFYGCSSLTTTITIANLELTDFDNMFSYSATNENASITVNYLDRISELVDSLIATKSDSSNVVKGNVTVLPTIVETSHYPYYTERNKSYTLFEKTFEGASSLTIIYDAQLNYDTGGMSLTTGGVAFAPKALPYGDSYDFYYNTLYYRHMNVTDYKVMIIPSYGVSYESTPYLLYRIPQTITIDGNYVKMVYNTYGYISYNNYYGIRAVIIPNYENDNS